MYIAPSKSRCSPAGDPRTYYLFLMDCIQNHPFMVQNPSISMSVLHPLILLLWIWRWTECFIAEQLESLANRNNVNDTRDVTLENELLVHRRQQKELETQIRVK